METQNNIETITNTYKMQFINDIIDEMTGFLSNSELMELNKSLNKHTSNLIISEKPSRIDLNYDETNTRLLKDFIKSKKIKGCTKQTIFYYNDILKKFQDWSIKSFIELDSNDIKDFLHFYQEVNNCGKVTLDNTRRVISTLYTYLENQELIIINPTRRIKSIKKPKKVRKAFTDTEIELLRDVVKNNIRNSAIMELLLSSGLRLNEISILKKDDISFPDCKGIVMGKGNKERIFYFSERARVLLEKYVNSRTDDKEWLFVQLNEPYNKFGSSGFSAMIRKLGKQAGVENVHPHRFRRTFATKLIRKGMPIEQVSKLLGHSSIDITLLYIESDTELLRLIHNKHTN